MQYLSQNHLHAKWQIGKFNRASKATNISYQSVYRRILLETYYSTVQTSDIHGQPAATHVYQLARLPSYQVTSNIYSLPPKQQCLLYSLSHQTLPCHAVLDSNNKQIDFMVFQHIMSSSQYNQYKKVFLT